MHEFLLNTRFFLSHVPSSRPDPYSLTPGSDKFVSRTEFEALQQKVAQLEAILNALQPRAFLGALDHLTMGPPPFPFGPPPHHQHQGYGGPGEGSSADGQYQPNGAPPSAAEMQAYQQQLQAYAAVAAAAAAAGAPPPPPPHVPGAKPEQHQMEIDHAQQHQQQHQEDRTDAAAVEALVEQARHATSASKPSKSRKRKERQEGEGGPEDPNASPGTAAPPKARSKQQRASKTGPGPAQQTWDPAAVQAVTAGGDGGEHHTDAS